MRALVGTMDWEGLEELRPLLRSSLARRCSDEHDVEDVVQETLLRAARYRRGLGDPERLARWVVRIGRNVCRDRRRTEWRLRRRFADEAFFEALPGTEGASPMLEEGPEGVCISGQEVDLETALRLLGQALAEHVPADRALLQHHYVARHTCRETAARCGIPAALVKVRLFRLRRRLGRRIERLLVRARLARLGVLEAVA